MADLLKILFFILILSVSSVSCGRNGDNAIPNKQKNTISEHEFVADQSLTMMPHHTVSMYMEPRDAMVTSHADTGTLGIDIIPLTIEQDGVYTYSIDEAGFNNGAISKVEMFRLPNRNRVFELNSGNMTVTITMTPGRYEMVLHSGFTVNEAGGADHRIVFLQPQSQRSGSKDKGLKQEVSNFVIVSNSCAGCDLVKADLRGANLTNTNLSRADLTEADLTGANLTGADLTEADTRGTVWTTGTLGRTVTIINSCSIDIWAGISGNNATKGCSTNNDCGGGLCDPATNPKQCKEIFCSSNTDCPVNAFCGGLSSYQGSCKGNMANECGSNRFCDTENENYFSNSPSCTADSDCAGLDSNAHCDIAQNKCFKYQCGWKTCYYVPIPVNNIISPNKDCTTNADCLTNDSFCYITSPGNGKCATINYEGNGFKMNASGSTQTLPIPSPWGGRFWPRTGCSEQCSQCPDAFCQSNSDCPSGRTCETGATPSKSSYCNADSQCKSYERCDMSHATIESPVCKADGNWTDQCQSDADCNNNSAYTNRGFKNMKCLTRNDLGCGGQTKPVNICVFSQCSSYRCSDSNNCDCSFQCDTGKCLGFDGKTFAQKCAAPGKDSPTLAEFFMPAFDGNNNDFYDISMVDGANVPVRIAPDPNSYNLETANGVDKNAACTKDSDCWDKKKSPSWACASSGDNKGYCINKFQCASPGCISNEDCDKYGSGAYLSADSKLKASPWGGNGFAISESACKEELKLKKNGVYIACMAPKDACSNNPSYADTLKCNQTISGQGTYLNLYQCDGANSKSCYSAGKDSNCCGCPEWTLNKDAFCQAGSNHTWLTYAQPYYKIFNTASPTAYSFPYDDFNSTFTCIGKSKEVNVNYTITFCPK